MVEDFNPNDPKWTNRMSIERKRVCEKCKDEDYGYKFYVEKQRIFYCCEKCAAKYKLKDLDTEANDNDKEWKILDKDGIEIPDDWAVTPRTYEKVKRLLDRLNINGEYRPYTMVEK